jgi:hypothetical protein
VRSVVLDRGLIAPQVLDRLLSLDVVTALGYRRESWLMPDEAR